MIKLQDPIPLLFSHDLNPPPPHTHTSIPQTRGKFKSRDTLILSWKIKLNVRQFFYLNNVPPPLESAAICICMEY